MSLGLERKAILQPAVAWTEPKNETTQTQGKLWLAHSRDLGELDLTPVRWRDERAEGIAVRAGQHH